MYQVGVIDLGFGDSGKGVTTSLLCSDKFNLGGNPRLRGLFKTVDQFVGYMANKVVVRSNGGHQAGHTVVFNGVQHVFSQFGAGTLQGVPSYLSKNFTVEPQALLKEYYLLLEKGVTPTLYIDTMAMLVTPWDIDRGRLDAERKGHGSVGVGFGQTIKRNEDHFHLYFQDIGFPKILRAKLQNIADHYYGDVMDERVEKFIACCEEIAKLSCVHHVTENWVLEHFSAATVIFESAQGVLLDQEFGFFPNVTRSHSSCKNMVNMFGGHLDEVFYVTRTYQTRHGNGFMSNEDKPITNLYNAHTETNKYNQYQGEFRKTELDVELLRYAITCNENYLNQYAKRNLVITCYDQHKVNLHQLVTDLITDLGFDFHNVFVSCSPDGTKMVKLEDLKD